MEIVVPDMAMVVGQSSETARRINSARSIDASSEEKLFAFFGRKVTRCFDRDVDLTGPVRHRPIWGKAWKAVSQGDFGDGDRIVGSLGVKICCNGGAYEGAEHYLPIGSVVGLGFLIVGNIDGSGVSGRWREDVGVVHWVIGSIDCG